MISFRRVFLKNLFSYLAYPYRPYGSERRFVATKPSSGDPEHFPKN